MQRPPGNQEEAWSLAPSRRIPAVHFDKEKRELTAVRVAACAPTSTSVGRGGGRGHCFKGDGVGGAALREESSVTPLRGLILGGDVRRLLSPCRLESLYIPVLSVPGISAPGVFA